MSHSYDFKRVGRLTKSWKIYCNHIFGDSLLWESCQSDEMW